MFAATLIVLCGCVSSGKTVLLEDSVGGTRVILNVGDTQAVKLKSNFTRGYSGRPAELPGSIELLKNKSESGEVGETGPQSYVFKAIKPCDSPLLLPYFVRLNRTSAQRRQFACLFRLRLIRKIPQNRNCDLLPELLFALSRIFV